MTGRDRDALDAKLAELDAKLREANGTLKDIRTERREVERLLATGVTDRINEAVREGLAEYDASLKAAIETGTQATYDRFDTIAGIVLGEEGRPEGGPPIEELIRRYIAKNGPVGGVHD